MTAAIILAAGASRRLGRPKQTVVFHGETLLARAVRTATEARLSPVLAIVPEPGWSDTLHPPGAIILVNPHAAEGIASSIRAGITHAQGLQASGAVLMTCDQVAVTPDHLRALAAQPAVTTGSAYAGKIGIPAYFPASTFSSLLKLSGDTGARDLLLTARSLPTEALAFDIDTEADLARAQDLSKL